VVRELAPSLSTGAVREGRFKHLRLVVAAGEPHAETRHAAAAVVWKLPGPAGSLQGT